jgi:type IV pilus assembly protein PilV
MTTQRGFSLLEVLVTSALLATALLGLAALGVRAVQDAALGRDQAAAFALLQDLEGRVALSGGRGTWRLPAAHTLPEWRSWSSEASGRLPMASATLCRDATPDDGTASDSACDGQGALTAKLFWRRFTESQRQSRTLTP